MGSISNRSVVLIIFIILISHFEFYAKAWENDTITCHQPRYSGAPSGDQLQSGLTANNAIQTICQTSPTNTLTTTFNNGYYYISIIRNTTNQTLHWCTSGLNAIISSCIFHQDFFGGLYVGSKESYNISNSGYPSNQDPLKIPPPKSTSLVRTGYIYVYLYILTLDTTLQESMPQSTSTPNLAGTNVVRSPNDILKPC
jgi:hypothetical protein